MQLLRENRLFRRCGWGRLFLSSAIGFTSSPALGLVRLVSNNAAGATTIILVARLVPFTLFALLPAPLSIGGPVAP